MKATMLALFAAAPLLSACGSFSVVSAPRAEWPWEDDSFCAAPSCNGKEALSAYIKASKFCRQVQNYYESGGQRANNVKLGVGIVGTLAGAVVAPIAKGTSATAWSGLSGVTNGLQTSFDEAFSLSLAVNRRVAVVAAAAEGEQAYAAQTNDNARVAAAVSMATACANASALADQKALQSLSSPATTQQSLRSGGSRQGQNPGAPGR